MKPIIFVLFGIFAAPFGAAGQQLPKHSLAQPASDEISMQIIPDPANGEVYVLWDMRRSGKATLSIADAEARMTLLIPLKKVPRCIYSYGVSVQPFSPGNYVAVLEIGNKVYSKEFVVSP